MSWATFTRSPWMKSCVPSSVFHVRREDHALGGVKPAPQLVGSKRTQVRLLDRRVVPESEHEDAFLGLAHLLKSAGWRS